MSLIPSTSSREPINGVLLLCKSEEYFDATLRQFRICHDFGVSAASHEILDKASLVEMDSYAIEFRKISSFYTCLLEKIASVWYGTCILFWQNLEKIQDANPSKLLQKISGNASELSSGFIFLSKRAEQLASKFQKFNVGSLSMQDKYVKPFKEEQQKRFMELEVAKQSQRTVEQHQKEYSQAEQFFFLCKLVAEAFGVMKTAKEHEVQLQADQLEEMQQTLAAQTSITKKAEIVVAEVAKLMSLLEKAAHICKEVSEVFEREAKHYKDMSEVSSGKELTEKYNIDTDIRTAAEELAKQKDILEKYHRRMSIVSNSYNFQPLIPESKEVDHQSKVRSFVDVLGVKMEF